MGVWQSHFWQIVVRVKADNGVVGYGYGGGGEPACLVVNQHFRELVVGTEIETVDDIRALWDRVYGAVASLWPKRSPRHGAQRPRFGALGSCLAKRKGRPVYDLLGGLRKPKVRGYATGGKLEQYRDMGYTAVKFPPGKSPLEADVRYTVDLARQARSIFGDDALIMTDPYMAWDFDTTKLMADALREFNVYWFEDVTTPDHLEEAGKTARDRSSDQHRRRRARVHTVSGSHRSPRQAHSTSGSPMLPGAGASPRRSRILDLARPSTTYPSCRIAAARSGACTSLRPRTARISPRRTPNDGRTPRTSCGSTSRRVVDGYLTPLDRPGFGVILNEAML